MPSTPVRPIWAGRTLAIIAIALIALNARTAVASLSPIVQRIADDIPLDSLGLGLLGMLPPIAFALAGVLTPLISRRVGLEPALVIACIAMIVGTLTRAFSSDYIVLVIGSAIVLLGMGIGNVMLPPAVKRYFPDRIALMTSLYVVLLSVSTTVPALFAEPVAAGAGWRVSVAVWAALAVGALLPWVMLAVRARRERLGATDELVPVTRLRGLHRSKVAWSIAITFVVSALIPYSLFAWLPLLLVEHVGVSEAQAGALLALFAIIGLPSGLVIPALVARMRNVGLIILLAVLFFVVGFLGLLLLPGGVVVWVILVGAGAVLFPVCLVLINLRSRTEQGSIALSGFAQGLGYTGGALGPLAVGFLHDVTGDWVAPIIALGLVALVAIIPAFMLAERRFVEDDLAERP